MGEIAGDFNPEWVKGKLVGLEQTLAEILDQSDREGRPSNLIADEIARQRIEEKRAAKLAKVA
ncbi:MAG: leucine dehydrogenase [Maricaulis maris]|jgi:leucine dehydrogenase